MSSPIFSIIIPGFNRLEPLKHTLHSALAAVENLGAPAEIILVDDGSEPPLASQLDQFAGATAIRNIRQPNQGSIVARLRGLSEAQGKYILFLDSDDLIHPDKLRLHRDALEQNDTDVAYDDMAEATLAPHYAATYKPGNRLPETKNSAELFLTVQPAPHGPTYRRDYLQKALHSFVVPLDRRMDASGDVWLYYNLLPHAARISKINAALTATGPHLDARYSQHWEKLGAAALLIAEGFMAHSVPAPQFHRSRRSVGEAAFQSWRRLPRDYRPDYAKRLLAIWQAAPRGATTALGGRWFRLLAAVVGAELAGRLLKQFNHTYASCRTLSDDELEKLLARAHPVA